MSDNGRTSLISDRMWDILSDMNRGAATGMPHDRYHLGQRAISIMTRLLLWLAACMLLGCHSADLAAGASNSATSVATSGASAAAAATAPARQGANTMKIHSPSFDNNGAIPAKYTCERNDTSPPLSWSDAPKGVKSFALIMDDPDAPDPAAPKRVWVHWVVFDIPPNVLELPEGAAMNLPAGAKSGLNDWKKAGYGGPCPPIGRHRYFHKIYALDTTLGLSQPTKSELEKAMEGHVLATGELIGTYQKQKK